MTITSVDKLDLRGKRVLVRVDFNVPLRDGAITDDTRIEAALPTIKMLVEGGARVVLMSHLGRPKGEVDLTYSLEPIAARLADLLEGEVTFTDDCIGHGVRKVVSEMRDGDVVLLENLRFHVGETKNDAVFSERLAASAEAYVSDAFGTLHRAHASTAGVARLLEPRAMGLLVQRELEALGRLLVGAKRPYIAVLGGAKVSDKIAVFDNLMPRVDGFIVGGAMAFTLLAARGKAVGRSLVEKEKIWQAKRIMERAADRGIALHLPDDFVVAASPDGESSSRTVSSIPDDMIGLDIGPQSAAAFGEVLAGASTIFWNGPMGMFEVPPFDAGTRSVAESLAGSGAFTVVGGGDSAAAMKQLGLEDRIGHISTGGGASLAFLGGDELPGLVALES